MKRGKHVCETLKAIRSKIAEENEIDYTPIECHHEGDCAGTCPACEREVRWLESMLRRRRALGKAVILSGLSVAMGTVMSSCNQQTTPSEANDYLEGDVCVVDDPDSLSTNIVSDDSTKSDMIKDKLVEKQTKVLTIGEFDSEEIVNPTEADDPAKNAGETLPDKPKPTE